MRGKLNQDRKNWWKNPKDPIFWFVLIPSVGLVISVFFNILSYTRPPTIVYLSQEPLAQTEMEDTITSPNLEGPRKLQEFLSQYPIIQRNEIFRRLYFGKVVHWKGTLIRISKFSDCYYEISKGDSIYLSTKLLGYYLDSSGNVVLADCEMKLKDVYHITLQHSDGSLFFGNVETEGNEYLDYLMGGEALSVRGVLIRANEIGNILNLGELQREN